jgi:hypothetical protein
LDFISKNYTKVVSGKNVVDSEAVLNFLLEEREQTLAQLLEEIKKSQKGSTKNPKAAQDLEPLIGYNGEQED